MSWFRRRTPPIPPPPPPEAPPPAVPLVQVLGSAWLEHTAFAVYRRLPLDLHVGRDAGPFGGEMDLLKGQRRFVVRDEVGPGFGTPASALPPHLRTWAASSRLVRVSEAEATAIEHTDVRVFHVSVTPERRLDVRLTRKGVELGALWFERTDATREPDFLHYSGVLRATLAALGLGAPALRLACADELAPREIERTEEELEQAATVSEDHRQTYAAPIETALRDAPGDGPVSIPHYGVATPSRTSTPELVDGQDVWGWRCTCRWPGADGTVADHLPLTDVRWSIEPPGAWSEALARAEAELRRRPS